MLKLCRREKGLGRRILNLFHAQRWEFINENKKVYKENKHAFDQESDQEEKRKKTITVKKKRKKTRSRPRK